MWNESRREGARSETKKAPFPLPTYLPIYIRQTQTNQCLRVSGVTSGRRHAAGAQEFYQSHSKVVTILVEMGCSTLPLLMCSPFSSWEPEANLSSLAGLSQRNAPSCRNNLLQPVFSTQLDPLSSSSPCLPLNRPRAVTPPRRVRRHLNLVALQALDSCQCSLPRPGVITWARRYLEKRLRRPEERGDHLHRKLLDRWPVYVPAHPDFNDSG